MNSLTIATIQQSCTADRQTTVAKSIAMIRQAASQGAELIILQELHTGLYFCQSEDTACFDLAEPIPGPSTDEFSAIARELGVVLVLSLFERRAAGLYHNTAAVIERDGTLAGIYRKMHIPDDPAFYEKFYFTPGDLGFQPIQTSVGRLGVLVCWDQWYPDAARLMALAGAELLIYPTAIGWDPADNDAEKARQLEAWITIQRSHAIANGIPVAVVNRVGFEAAPANNGNGILFWGNSFVAGCQGEFLRRSTPDGEEVSVVTLDMNRSETVRRIWPFLRDRRIDEYKRIISRFID
ncbi:MAG: carbon-nitrogen hydrolase [Geobacter sp.]|nr:carbon-nitrogen hydrolase [Geobacter sp.]